MAVPRPLLGGSYSDVPILFGWVGTQQQRSALETSCTPGEAVRWWHGLYSAIDLLFQEHSVSTMRGDVGSLCGFIIPTSGDRDSGGMTRMVTFADMLLRQAITLPCFPDGSAVALRLGVSHGAVADGVIGSYRLQYMLVGRPVSVACALAKAAAPGQLLVAQEALQCLHLPQQRQCRKLPDLHLSDGSRLDTYAWAVDAAAPSVTPSPPASATLARLVGRPAHCLAPRAAGALPGLSFSSDEVAEAALPMLGRPVRAPAAASSALAARLPAPVAQPAAAAVTGAAAAGSGSAAAAAVGAGPSSAPAAAGAGASSSSAAEAAGAGAGVVSNSTASSCAAQLAAAAAADDEEEEEERLASRGRGQDALLRFRSAALEARYRRAVNGSLRSVDYALAVLATFILLVSACSACLYGQGMAWLQWAQLLSAYLGPVAALYFIRLMPAWYSERREKVWCAHRLVCAVALAAQGCPVRDAGCVLPLVRAGAFSLGSPLFESTTLKVRFHVQLALALAGQAMVVVGWAVHLALGHRVLAPAALAGQVAADVLLPGLVVYVWDRHARAAFLAKIK